MKKILVVDDMNTVRMFHRMILEEAGFSVEEAGNGLEGVEKALGTPFDLLLADVNMPKLDGYEMIRALRRESSTRSLPIIMISTEAEALDKEKAYLAGASLYMIKPVRAGQLREVALLLTGSPRS